MARLLIPAHAAENVQHKEHKGHKEHKVIKGNPRMTPNEASHLVIGAAIRVHTALGPGLLESAYHSCLYYEFTKAGLTFEHELHLPLIYDGVEIPMAYRVDFIIENCLIVELKCLEHVLPVHLAHLLSYLKLSGLKLGLLLNFNFFRMRDGVHRKINGREWELDRE
jgi:GxxExxY protein